MQLKTLLNRVHPVKGFVYTTVVFVGGHLEVGLRSPPDAPYFRARYSWASSESWLARAMRSRLEPVKKVARTIRSHRKLILNWFKARKQFNSGIVEGWRVEQQK